jgi:hypothetical protein
MAVRTVFLNDQQIKALKILAQMRIDELTMVNENPNLISIYQESVANLGRAQ